MTRVTREFTIKVTDSAPLTGAKLTNFKTMLSRTVAAMAGFGSDHSMVTIPGFTISTSMSVTAHLDVSSSHQLKAAQVEANMKAMTASQINEALAMRVGTCSFTTTFGGYLASGGDSTSATVAAGVRGALLLVLVAVATRQLWC
jgi:hypothetical protein